MSFPIIVPAHRRVYLDIEATIEYKETTNDDLPLNERQKFRKEVEEYLRTKYENIDGFQMMIEEQKVQIELPGGWRESKK